MSATRFWIKVYTISPGHKAKFEASARDALTAAAIIRSLAQMTGLTVLVKCDGLMLGRYTEQSIAALRDYEIAASLREKEHERRTARWEKRLVAIEQGAAK